MRYFNDSIYPFFALLAAVLIYIVGMITIRSDFIYAYIGLIILILVAFGYKKQLIKYSPILIGLSLFMFIVNFFLARDVERAWIALLRAFIFGLTVILGISIRPGTLFRVMVNNRVPKQIALGILISQQFVSRTYRELQKVNNARKVRGKNPNLSFFQNIYRAYIIPLVLRIVTISDNLGSSIEVRGFSIDNEGSYIDQTKVETRDWAFLGAVIILCIVGVWQWQI